MTKSQKKLLQTLAVTSLFFLSVPARGDDIISDLEHLIAAPSAPTAGVLDTSTAKGRIRKLISFEQQRRKLEAEIERQEDEINELNREIAAISRRKDASGTKIPLVGRVPKASKNVKLFGKSVPIVGHIVRSDTESRKLASLDAQKKALEARKTRIKVSLESNKQRLSQAEINVNTYIGLVEAIQARNDGDIIYQQAKDELMAAHRNTAGGAGGSAGGTSIGGGTQISGGGGGSGGQGNRRGAGGSGGGSGRGSGGGGGHPKAGGSRGSASLGGGSQPSNADFCRQVYQDLDSHPTIVLSQQEIAKLHDLNSQQPNSQQPKMYKRVALALETSNTILSDTNVTNDTLKKYATFSAKAAIEAQENFKTKRETHFNRINNCHLARLLQYINHLKTDDPDALPICIANVSPQISAQTSDLSSFIGAINKVTNQTGASTTHQGKPHSAQGQGQKASQSSGSSSSANGRMSGGGINGESIGEEWELDGAGFQWQGRAPTPTEQRILLHMQELQDHVLALQTQLNEMVQQHHSTQQQQAVQQQIQQTQQEIQKEAKKPFFQRLFSKKKTRERAQDDQTSGDNQPGIQQQSAPSGVQGQSDQQTKSRWYSGFFNRGQSQSTAKRKGGKSNSPAEGDGPAFGDARPDSPTKPSLLKRAKGAIKKLLSRNPEGRSPNGEGASGTGAIPPNEGTNSHQQSQDITFSDRASRRSGSASRRSSNIDTRTDRSSDTESDTVAEFSDDESIAKLHQSVHGEQPDPTRESDNKGTQTMSKKSRRSSKSSIQEGRRSSSSNADRTSSSTRDSEMERAVPSDND